ncbi:unnamed protein product [Acanthosepion pharaonis]|uniref:Uncharacterized protein n=1 Tax=Acanthosepion pharaonis TaxID=158019 RepID=A0A812AMQ6_ACAPH|nr:unnamed protein product [Sepia pharaonis]
MLFDWRSKWPLDVDWSRLMTSFIIFSLALFRSHDGPELQNAEDIVPCRVDLGLSFFPIKLQQGLSQVDPTSSFLPYGHHQLLTSSFSLCLSSPPFFLSSTSQNTLSSNFIHPLFFLLSFLVIVVAVMIRSFALLFLLHYNSHSLPPPHGEREKHVFF